MESGTDLIGRAQSPTTVKFTEFENGGKYMEAGSFSLPTKQTSMCSLIIWNISKALEKNPCMDLRDAMHLAHDRLENASVTGIVSQPPEERHLICALLAWQQLGHKDLDSLYQFIDDNRNKPPCDSSENRFNKNNICSMNKAGISAKPKSSVESRRSKYSEDVDSSSFDTYSLMGPVVKLPVETKFVMRVENTPDICSRHNAKKPKRNDVMNKIDAACCKDSECMRRLTDLDKATSELRGRASRLAHRQSERVELLERAEAAWKDLEVGYIRRLSLAEEKEEDLAKQTKKLIDERNAYKNACTNLAQILKQRGDAAEKERSRLTLIEKEVCDRACTRLRLSAESARGDAAVADELCKATQLDRDLQFKEEQARRKVLSLESEVESMRGLGYEAERAMRMELGALKDQITLVSKQLLAQEHENNQVKAELEELRQEKSEIIEDLDGCKDMCDQRMQSKVEELKQKRDQLNELKGRVMECQCKLPQDAAVEAKRTPSLAAMCHCSPEDKFLESCSCTSMRTQLLSNLLADLFGGLQAELGSGPQMPCQLLKCLEDRHNWDRSSIVKTNLRNYFAQLLIGELDFAIATSIEKYHVKWVGRTCADQIKMVPEPGEDENEGWQEHAIERRAQKLATELAEQLFKERSEQLTKKAKEIMTAGPPPCECKGKLQAAAVYPCLVKAPLTPPSRKVIEAPPPYLKRTIKDVNQLRVQIEDLKKETIKKEDLKQIEDKIAKIALQASKFDNVASTSRNTKYVTEIQDNFSGTEKRVDDMNSKFFKKKSYDSSSFKKCFKSSMNNIGRVEKHSSKLFKKNDQSFAVNLCLCGGQDKLKKDLKRKDDFKTSWSKKKSSHNGKVIDNIKQSRPTNLISPGEINQLRDLKFSDQGTCPNNCVCFHKIPSDTSLNKLLETLTNWKSGLNMMTGNKENNSICSNKRQALYEICENQSINNRVEEVKSPRMRAKVIRDISPNFSKHAHQFSKDDNERGTDNNIILAPTTESEYIGAMNLDKSNDNICKCTKCHKNYEIEHGDGYDKSSKSILKCIDGNSCNCKKSFEENTEVLLQNNLKNNKSELTKESQAYSVIVQDPPIKTINTQYLFHNNDVSKHSAKLGTDSFICDVVKNSELFPCNCDYSVKFLGVTLTNTDTGVQIKKKYEEHEKSLADKNINDENAYKAKKNAHMKLKNDSRCGLDNCEYGEILLKSVNVPNNNDNKLDEKQNQKETANNEESCVCCKHEGESHDDIEMNTFNLLEEHLKGKLTEIQHSSCKSPCIPPEEERKLFSTILQKVKQVISESTNNLTCKCEGVKSKEGSWSRAYGLLQEYLKVKIKRVQCVCSTNEDRTDSVLPSILNKVCNLIETDFQRLKDKCQCNNNDRNININFLTTNTEKPLNKNQPHQIQNDIYVQFDISKDNGIYEKPVNAKLYEKESPKLKNKSCDVVSDDFPNNDNTMDKTVSCALKDKNNTLSCDCQYTLTESNYADKEIIVNQCTEILKYNSLKEPNNLQSTLYEKFDEIKNEDNHENDCPNSISNSKLPFKIPYIGYTLSCSCDRNLGNCHCTKSLVQTNNGEIEFIWKSVTKENCPKKISYIMHKALNDTKSDQTPLNSHIIDVLQQSAYPIYRKDYENMQTCTVGNDEEIVLKDSKSNLKYVHSTNTNTVEEMSIGTNPKCNEEASCWYDCRPHDNDYQNDKDLLFDSLYFPMGQYPKTQSNNIVDAKSETGSEKCECKMVPICHVKMLVDNIENKLVQSKCTCDTLSSQVCPIHSRQEFYFN